MRRIRRPLRWVLFASLLMAVGCGQSACETVNNIGEFIDSISDGAPCDSNFVCLGGRCLSAEQGYPGGYCTTFNCETDGCSGLSSECFRTEVEGQEVTACFELCDFDGTCERAEEGYLCVTLDDTAVCLPPGVTNAAPQGATGSSCSANAQCNGENATCLTNFFGGYCSQLDCAGSAECLGGNPCLATDPDDPDQTACFQACDSDDDCRFQYSCQDHEGVSVCLEGERDAARNPDGADDGEPCNSQLNCKGGTCIREAQGEGDADVAWPGGYCTTRDCETDDDCNGGLCVQRARSTTCLAPCESNSDCRDGYECVDSPGGTVCDTIVEPVTPDPDASPAFDVTCGSSKSFTFTIPSGSEGFFLGPYTRDGQKIVPTTLEYPDGTTLDIRSEYEFMAINPEILGSMAPILFPGSDRAQFRDVFGGGEWTLTVQSASNDICFYAIPQENVGSQLDINLYFVGVPGLDAGAAESDADMREVVEVVRAIYDKMDVTAEVANHIDVSDAVESNYSVIRDFNDVYDLVASSTAPGSGRDAALSVNVFLINDFNISEAPGLLGVSTGIPGVAGLHGNSGAGLVFSTASLGDDNRQLGQTMAHEIGHFLGLRHTTEHGFGVTDPITDTPECINPQLANFCPDSDNFMFAFALGGQQQGVTGGQAYVVRRNPLVK